MGLLTRDAPKIEPAVVDPFDEGPGGPWGKGVGKAREKLAAALSRCEECTADLAARRLELEGVEGRAGAEAYDDAAAAERIAGDIARLRAGIDVAGRVLTVADEKVVEAKRAVLAAQAAELRDRIRGQRRVLSEREAKTASLLEQLKAHEEAEYTPAEAPADTELAGQRWDQGSSQITLTQRMRHELDRLTVWAWTLEEVAAGRPLPLFVGTEPIAEYPVSLRGPHALFSDHPRLEAGAPTFEALPRLDAIRAA